MLFLPTSLFIYLLYTDDSARKLAFLVFLIQVFVFLLPTFQLIKNRMFFHLENNYKKYPSNSTQMSVDERAKFFESMAHAQQYGSFVFQIATVYLINQCFFSQIVFLRDNINMDVQPHAGRIGMLDWDKHPLFNAFLMAFHKVICFFIFIFIFIIIFIFFNLFFSFFFSTDYLSWVLFFCMFFLS